MPLLWFIFDSLSFVAFRGILHFFFSLAKIMRSIHITVSSVSWKVDGSLGETHANSCAMQLLFIVLDNRYSF